MVLVFRLLGESYANVKARAVEFDGWEDERRRVEG
jgi:hypothetical protein